MSAPLYNRQILALAVETAQTPPLNDVASRGGVQAVVRAPICGSVMTLDLVLDDAGHVADLGMKVEACALGQAAAAIFARHARGRDEADLRTALADVSAWLKGDGAVPTWPDFAILEAVKDYPARHGAILLPFEAAVQAMGLRCSVQG